MQEQEAKKVRKKQSPEVSYRATHKYTQKNYDSMLINVPKGTRDQIKALAAEAGVSTSRYILQAVEEKSGLKLKLTLDNALPWVREEREENDK